LNSGISVILCTYNGAERLPETLRHLAQQEVNSHLPWEVIVVDNASTDGTAQVAEKCWQTHGGATALHIIVEPRPGKGHALTTGIRNSKYSYCLICDDDNRLETDYVRLAYRTMERHPEIGILGGHGTPAFETHPPAWFSRFQAKYGVGPQAPEPGCLPPEKHYVYGAGSVIRKTAYQTILDAGFPALLVGPAGGRQSGGGEDAELCHAMKLAGYRLWYDDHLRFSHFIPSCRLRWRYLLGLERTTSNLDVVAKAYKAFLEEDIGRSADRVAIHEYLRKSLVKNITGLLRLFVRRMAHPLAGFEGNRTDQLIVRRMVWLKVLLRQRSTLEWNILTVARFVERLTHSQMKPKRELEGCNSGSTTQLDDTGQDSHAQSRSKRCSATL
jgi:glycosyltransferase involved in cell wall biosynthesis